MLLERGARRVFALDAGFGQLRGSLRLDPRVVDLERTNLADAGRVLPDIEIGLVTLDLSYVSLATAVPELEDVRYALGADLVGLVKPMYELGLAAPPEDPSTLDAALQHALRGIERTGSWRVRGSVRSPVVGRRGAREWLVHAHHRR